jgi:hypothetical protein
MAIRFNARGTHDAKAWYDTGNDDAGVRCFTLAMGKAQPFELALSGPKKKGGMCWKFTGWNKIRGL